VIPLTPAWFIFWFIYEALVFTAAIFAGIVVFRVSQDNVSPLKTADNQRTDEAMYREA
jgi:hypothetical protein